MGVLERVARLVRANLNDLIDRAEDPAKLLKQVLLDMENQHMQVKTQVAIAIADLHLLDKKKKENEQAESDSLRRAETALNRSREDLARAAAAKAVEHRQLAAGYGQQLTDQRIWVEHLKTALRDLGAKREEARHQAELLVARQRRARALTKATQAQSASTSPENLRRMNNKVLELESMAEATAELNAPGAEAELIRLEKNEAVENILEEIRNRRQTRPR
jgi:phage shock protein A